MEYRIVPKTGDAISILGYGAMRFPTVRGKIDEEKAKKQLRFAIDSGLNYIDTAYFYHGGQSESFLGRALKDGYREKVKIATKMPPWLVHTKDDLDQIFQTQLGRLQVENIDYYLLHAINKETWDKFNKLDTLAYLTSLKEKGLIKNVGFSFHGDRLLFKEVIDAYPWDFCQIQYNILDETNQAGREGLLYAAEKQIAVFVMEPLRGGTLASKLPKEAQERYAHTEKNWTPVEWALKWIWNHPEVTMLLSGMTEDQHIEDNLRYASEMKPSSMTAEDTAVVDDVKAIYKRLQKVPCTACQYCMPCPFGVDIPRCFDLYNSKYMLDQKVKTFYWMQLGGMNCTPSHASLCVNCGKCVPKCPQSIDIPRRLKEVTADLEGPLMLPAMKLGKKVLKFYTVMKKKRSNKQ